MIPNATFKQTDRLGTSDAVCHDVVLKKDGVLNRLCFFLSVTSTWPLSLRWLGSVPFMSLGNLNWPIDLAPLEFIFITTPYFVLVVYLLLFMFLW